jgi:ADP-ribose pyrophosphatase YjhB (NUDIX family)
MTERYQRLLEISLEGYASLTEIDIEEIRSTFLKETGNISPKSAASGAIFNEHGQILLIRRTDDGKLTVPGGACDPGESPRETAVREVREETGLNVAAHDVIDVFCNKAGTHNRIFTTHSTMYYCTVVSGDFGPTLEATEVGFRNHKTVPDHEWHQDFKFRIQTAYDFWLKNIKGT